MSASSNPGAATPESLHKLYKNQAAVTANPYTLRQFASHQPRHSAQGVHLGRHAAVDNTISFNGVLVPRATERPQPVHRSKSAPRMRSESPPRANFRCVSATGEMQGFRQGGVLLNRR